MALFSIPRERIDTFREHKSRSRRLIYALLLDGQRTLLLILLCNLFVNLTLAGLINSLVAAIMGKRATFWSFMAATAVIIAFGEILPKNGAMRHNERIAAFAAPILYNLKILASPLLNLIKAINWYFMSIFKVHLRRPSPFITIDELQSAIRSSCERGVISESERGIISNLLDKGAQPVKRFMIHRSRIPFLPHYTTVSDALGALADAGRTFALVTRGSRGDQIMGIARLPELLAASPGERCRKFAKPPQWVPETLEAADLVSFMFAKNLGVVCVLDEFGGTSGAFSLSEGLSKIMAFRTEKTPENSSPAKIFSGMTEIEAMADWLPQSLVSANPDVRTLNGLLTRRLGRIPKSGENFDIGGQKFYIIYAGHNKIESVLVSKSVDLKGPPE
jgi:CBS domain containing-hemolysin-like protein